MRIFKLIGAEKKKKKNPTNDSQSISWINLIQCREKKLSELSFIAALCGAFQLSSLLCTSLSKMHSHKGKRNFAEKISWNLIAFYFLKRRFLARDRDGVGIVMKRRENSSVLKFSETSKERNLEAQRKLELNETSKPTKFQSWRNLAFSSYKVFLYFLQVFFKIVVSLFSHLLQLVFPNPLGPSRSFPSLQKRTFS